MSTYFAIYHREIKEGYTGGDYLKDTLLGVVSTAREASEYCAKHSKAKVYENGYRPLMYGLLWFESIDESKIDSWYLNRPLPENPFYTYENPLY